MTKQSKFLGRSTTTTVDNKTRRVVVLPGQPSKDFILDAKCLIVPVGGRISMSATDLPDAQGGIYTWSTTSSKIRLINTHGNLLAIEAMQAASAARGNEKILVERKAPDGSTTTKTVALTVAKVTFGPTPKQSYGYDDFDSPSTPSDHRISVRSSGETLVRVTIEGGALGNDFDFLCDDPTVCVAGGGASKAEFDLGIQAERWERASTVLQAKVKCPSAAVFAEINLHVYTEQAINVLVAKVVDLSSPSTALKYPNADYAAHQNDSNRKLKEAVVTCQLRNFDVKNGVTDIKFDKDSTGALSFDINAKGGAAFSLIKQTIVKDSPKQHCVVILRNMRSYYYLSRQAKKGDTEISVRGNNVFPALMPLGVGANAETVEVTKNIGNIGYLAAPLSFDHAVGEPLEFPAAGWSSDPVIIAEGDAPPDIVKWTVLHEVGHRAFDFDDVVDSTNLMHFDQSNTDARLRYCPRDSQYYPGKKENQWEKIPRPEPGRAPKE
jgi:hypothetical protein